MSRTTIEVMIDNIVTKWERITGRKSGDAYFQAPETSSTLSIVYALQDLDTRLKALEQWMEQEAEADRREVENG